MVDPIALAAFIPAALALNLTPGADMVFCIGQGVRSGPPAAWAASAGVATGGMIHVLIAGAGLSALLVQWPVAFDVIRWIGVGYLLWLAYQTLSRAARPRDIPATGQKDAYVTGLFVNLTNPKVILFVLAFIPQFIVPDAGPVIWQFAVFGLVIAFGGLIVNGVAGMWAGSVGQRVARGSPVLDYITAGLFSALALRLAILERS